MLGLSSGNHAFNILCTIGQEPISYLPQPRRADANFIFRNILFFFAYIGHKLKK